MRTSFFVVAVVVVAACSPASMPDAGSSGGGAGSMAGGSTAGGSMAGGSTAGGSAAGGSAAGGSTAGGSSAGGSAGGGAAAGGTAVLPDGGVGTLVGPTTFGVTAARSVVGAGGRPSVFVTALYNAAPVSCATSPNPPFSVLLIRVTNTDGGAVTVGTWPIDGVGTKVTRDDFLSTGQGPDGGEATSGTVTITRLESGRASGTYSASMTFYNLTSGTLTGSWDAPVCP